MKISTPQGTRDFAPEVVYKRQYILRTIQKFFELYGYQPLETPAMENLTTLMGKYGDEGDKLIFKILNNGLAEPNKQEKVQVAWNQVLQGKNDVVITERALRYDLTIPFARYVVMNQGTLAFPFKRYQMQPVWRADRPQRGRYREFWQCDADVVGANSLFNEAELLCIYTSSFRALKIPGVTIKINNRKILAALATAVGQEDKMIDLTVAIDKLDKIGIDKVNEELTQKGFDSLAINKINQFLNISGSNDEKLSAVEQIIDSSDLALKGINELKSILSYYNQLCIDEPIVEIDFTLARGLNYYTGMITEVVTNAVKMGSIGGGGRYDDLTGLFGLKNMSGVGVSFGIDRIYDVMEELDLFPEELTSSSKVLFVSFDKTAESFIIEALVALRQAGIATEYYSELGKMDKQMKYANRRNFPFVAIIGEQELQERKISLKNMSTGTQEQYSIDSLIKALG